MITSLKLFAFACLLLTVICQTYPTANFSVLNVSKTDLTVSGISSGAFFADQLQVIYSSFIIGSGSYAGGPFYCAQGTLDNAFIQCMYNTEQISISSIVTQANTYASQGLIDPLSNLKNAHAWIFSGTQDTTVKQSVSQALQQLYEQWDVNIVTNFDTPAAHNWVNNKYGNECGVSYAPYIAICTGNFVQDMLTQIYGGNKTINAPVAQVSSNLFQFDQTTYTPANTFTSLSDTGYAYIPTACQQGQLCSLHFAFHGCEQDFGAVGDAFITETHLNEYAEANNIIVIFPQVSKTSTYIGNQSNPNGCWDWWGYTTADYSNNQGPQNIFFRNMVKEIAGF